MRAKKNEQDESEVDASSGPRRVTPIDIQEKVFRQAKGPFRGYEERDVDAFLDEVTEEVARLHSENKGLREQLAQRTTGGFEPAIVAGAGGDPELRDLTSSFISRERAFLQSLAGIIQQHAESVKQDVRRARAVIPQQGSRAPEMPATDPGDRPREPAGVVDLTGAEPQSLQTPVQVAPAQGSSPLADQADDASIREMFWGEE